MERLLVDYGKKSKFGFSIYPAPQVKILVTDVTEILVSFWSILIM